MSINDPAMYGRDLLCVDDADGLFSDVVGLAVLAQDAYHRLTNDSVLGSIDGEEPNEETDNFGYDCMKLLGMSPSKLQGMPPVLAAALQKDPRVFTADVVIKAERVVVDGQLYSLSLAARCTTALGPFTLVLGINDVTVAIIGGSTKQ